MTSTTKIDTYGIRFSDGSEMRIKADTVKASIDRAASASASASVTTAFLDFELDGVVVAKYKLSDVSGWRIVS